jgi:hypothetical protein
VGFLGQILTTTAAANIRRGSETEHALMSKERNTSKEDKKKPTMTPKERKAAKRAKKEAKQSSHR